MVFSLGKSGFLILYLEGFRQIAYAAHLKNDLLDGAAAHRQGHSESESYHHVSGMPAIEVVVINTTDLLEGAEEQARNLVGKTRDLYRWATSGKDNSIFLNKSNPLFRDFPLKEYGKKNSSVADRWKQLRNHENDSKSKNNANKHTNEEGAAGNFFKNDNEKTTNPIFTMELTEAADSARHHSGQTKTDTSTKSSIGNATLQTAPRLIGTIRVGNKLSAVHVSLRSNRIVFWHHGGADTYDERTSKTFRRVECPRPGSASTDDCGSDITTSAESAASSASSSAASTASPVASREYSASERRITFSLKSSDRCNGDHEVAGEVGLCLPTARKKHDTTLFRQLSAVRNRSNVPNVVLIEVSPAHLSPESSKVRIDFLNCPGGNPAKSTICPTREMTWFSSASKTWWTLSGEMQFPASTDGHVLRDGDREKDTSGRMEKPWRVSAQIDVATLYHMIPAKDFDRFLHHLTPAPVRNECVVHNETGVLLCPCEKLSLLRSPKLVVKNKLAFPKKPQKNAAQATEFSLDLVKGFGEMKKHTNVKNKCETPFARTSEENEWILSVPQLRLKHIALIPSVASDAPSIMGLALPEALMFSKVKESVAESLYSLSAAEIYRPHDELMLINSSLKREESSGHDAGEDAGEVAEESSEHDAGQNAGKDAGSNAQKIAGEDVEPIAKDVFRPVTFRKLFDGIDGWGMFLLGIAASYALFLLLRFIRWLGEAKDYISSCLDGFRRMWYGTVAPSSLVILDHTPTRSPVRGDVYTMLPNGDGNVLTSSSSSPGYLNYGHDRRSPVTRRPGTASPTLDEIVDISV